MKIILFLLLIFIGLLSCNSNSENADVNQKVDSSLFIPSSYDFIINYTNIRKEANKTVKEYEINSEIIISNSDFYIINFTEKIENYTYPYCIVINPVEKNEYHLDVRDRYNEIFSSIEKQNLPFSLFLGNVKQTLDFSNDGAPDYILTFENNLKTNVIGSSELLLYNGKADLRKTKVIAYSDFESGICENLIGVKEELIINNKSQKITISRHENISSSGNCNDENLIKLNYEKDWKWDNAKLEFTYLLNTPMLDTLVQFQDFLKKFTFLTEIDGKTVVMENCQNGGANTYQFSKYGKNESAYMLRETEANIESYFVAGFKKLDEKSALFYLRPTSSMENIDDIEAIEKAKALNIVKISKDENINDKYWITLSPDLQPNQATIQPDKYTFVKCDN